MKSTAGYWLTSSKSARISTPLSTDSMLDIHRVESPILYCILCTEYSERKQSA